MSDEYPPLIALPTELSDEAAAQLIAWLYDLAGALENHYTGQLLRYHLGREDAGVILVRVQPPQEWLSVANGELDLCPALIIHLDAGCAQALGLDPARLRKV